MINNKVTHGERLKGREQCQVPSILLKNNQNNNASSSIQHASNEQSQQTQNKHKTNSRTDTGSTHPETTELAYEKGEFQKDPDNLEEIVESLTNEENVNIFLVRQRLRFIKGNPNSQETKDSMYLDLHIVAHNIDGIASTPSIQKLHSLLEFIEENNIDIMAISETNIDYRQEYFINQDIKSKVYSIVFILHVVLGDFNDTIDNKIDRSPSTEQPGSQFLIQLSQLGLYDVCRALYPDTELFTHEKWDKNKDKSNPISRSRIDQIWITHEADVIPVRLSGDFRSTRNPKIRSALRFGSQVTSEKWKSKEFVQLSGDFRRMEIQRIRSALRFGSQVTSEEWKSKEFVQLSGDFRRMEKTKFRSVSGVSGGISKNRIPKDSFLSVLGSWIYRFRLSFLGLWIYGFRLSVIGLWIYGFRLSVIGLWIGFHFELILNRSGFHFEFLVRFSFGLLLNGFLFWTFLTMNGGWWMVDGRWWMVDGGGWWMVVDGGG
ncbi:unnamed protein product [Rhizophagus irregularis]|nr:unnamed protein product [Rhizophagus irregularis]